MSVETLRHIHISVQGLTVTDAVLLAKQQLIIKIIIL